MLYASFGSLQLSISLAGSPFGGKASEIDQLMGNSLRGEKRLDPEMKEEAFRSFFQNANRQWQQSRGRAALAACAPAEDRVSFGIFWRLTKRRVL
jgi:hypothetical protein